MEPFDDPVYSSKKVLGANDQTQNGVSSASAAKTSKAAVKYISNTLKGIKPGIMFTFPRVNRTYPTAVNSNIIDIAN